MGTGDRFGACEVEDEDGAAFLAVQTTVFVQWHRLHSQRSKGSTCLFGEDTIRKETGVDRASQCQGTDRCGAGFQQSLGAFIQSRACRIHIIDEEEPASCDGIRVMDGKGLSEIAKAFGP